MSAGSDQGRQRIGANCVDVVDGSVGRKQNGAGWRLDAGGGTFKPVGMGPNEVEDATAEFNSRVQIVSPPPDFSDLTFLI